MAKIIIQIEDLPEEGKDLITITTTNDVDASTSKAVRTAKGLLMQISQGEHEYTPYYDHFDEIPSTNEARLLKSSGWQFRSLPQSTKVGSGLWYRENDGFKRLSEARKILLADMQSALNDLKSELTILEE